MLFTVHGSCLFSLPLSCLSKHQLHFRNQVSAWLVGALLSENCMLLVNACGWLLFVLISKQKFCKSWHVASTNRQKRKERPRSLYTHHSFSHPGWKCCRISHGSMLINSAWLSQNCVPLLEDRSGIMQFQQGKLQIFRTDSQTMAVCMAAMGLVNCYYEKLQTYSRTCSRNDRMQFGDVNNEKKRVKYQSTWSINKPILLINTQLASVPCRYDGSIFNSVLDQCWEVA